MSYDYGSLSSPQAVAARFQDAHIDDDEDDKLAAPSYQYPDLEDESDADALPPFPFFHSADPALQSAYSYGDPRAHGGAYPDIHSTDIAQPPADASILFEGDEDETAAVGDLDDASLEPFDLDKATMRSKKQNLDPDFEYATRSDSVEEEGGEDEEDDESSDEHFAVAQPVVRRGRGRGRGRGSQGVSRAQPSGSLRGRGRGRPRGRGRGRGKRADPMFADDTPSDASGDFPAQVRRRKKKNKENVAITPEFRILNAKMTKEWLAQNYQEALKVGLQVIKMNPHVFEVHAMIAEILAKLGRHDDAVGALFTGAHSSTDPETWWYVVNRFKEIEAPDADVNNKIGYCYTAIINLRRDDYDARKARMLWWKSGHHILKARNECIKLLELGPLDADICREMIDLSLSIDDPKPAVPHVEAFLERCLGQSKPEDTQLSWILLNECADIYIAAKRFKQGTGMISRACRWLLDRADETCWDEVDDDREWDFDHEPRRTPTDGFQPDKHPLGQYGAALPIELRVKIGLLRISMGGVHASEGLQHFEYLLYDDLPEEEIVENNDLYREIADTLREADLHEEALKYYTPLRNVEGLLSSNDFFMLAICYQALGDQDGVQACIKEISSGSSAGDVTFQIGLAKLCQAQGQEHKMWKLISTLRRNGKSDQIRKAGLPLEKPYDSSTEASSGEADDIVDRAVAIGNPALRRRLKGARARKPEPPVKSAVQKPVVRAPRKYKPRLASPARIEKLKAPIIRSIFAEVRACEESIEGERCENPQWVSLVNELWLDYKTQGRFYGDNSRSKPFVGPGRDRFMAIPEDSNLVEESEFNWTERPEYRGVKIDHWVDKLLEYAVSLAKLDQADHCWEVIKSVDDSNVVYMQKERRRATRTAAIMCALLLEDEQKLCECGRYFIHNFPYQTDVYRLYSALNTIIRGPRTWFNSGPEQKYLARAIKSMDFALLDPAHYDVFGLTLADKARMTSNGKSVGNPHDLAQHDPALLALYGHVMLVAGSCTTALTYYFRAYALVPDDVVLNLCMGISYLQLAFKRLVDNRQSHVQQGLLLIYRYHELRANDGIVLHQQEAEFNLALVWHTLGLLHLAIPQYEKVISLSAKVRDELAGRMDGGPDLVVVEDFAVEAAYALQLIFAISGDMTNARRVTHDWLIL